jgi:hypothetical protein
VSTSPRTASRSKPTPALGALLLAGSANRTRFSGARWQDLLAALPATVVRLGRRRAGEVPEGYLDDYVTLQWMVWNGGTLKLTDTGRNVVRLLESADAERADAPEPPNR